MNEKVLHTLEFDKITDRLAGCATSEPGKKLCRELLPMDNLHEIERAQQETEAAVSYIFRKGSVNFGSLRDFSYAFGSLAIGSTLTAPELLHISSFLNNVDRVKKYGTTADGGSVTDIASTVRNSGKEEDFEEQLKNGVLYDLFDCLYPLRPVAREIDRCILSEEDIADDASTGLKKVRREMDLTGDRIHQQLQKMVNTTYASYLQDSVITLRGDRYCIPVKAENKGNVPGIVHDQSSSGSTLFIEPTAIVNLNNRLRELALEEKKEIEKILASLSAELAEHLMELKDDAANMTTLDFIFARASLAVDMNASKPLFNDRHYINIRQGRHPLIDKKRVVPIDISMGDTYDMIVITGPNTGGKTVTLKTVGLFELMGMAGLHIPASDRSELSLFRDVFADIGDEQSIEQNLSTFSAHMTTTVNIIRNIDRDCLCLFDELGAGTDPTEGAALAISILNFMHVRHITTLATTHYSELKVYAMTTEGVTNASCEFDVETLQPTYHLLIGVPGKSNAFAISKKLGLPDYIIETAKEQLSQETKNFEDVLGQLEQSRKEAEKAQEETEKLRAELEKRQKELDNREKQLNDKKDEIVRRANQQARDILADAKKTADEAISSLRKSGSGGNMAEMERTRSALRKKVSKKEAKAAPKTAPAQRRGKKLKPSDIHVGDKVRILSMGMTGFVTSLPDRQNKVGVRIGIMQSFVALDDLALINEDAFGNEVKGNGRTSLRKSFERAGGSGNQQRDLDLSQTSTISPELNLLGKTTDEAIHELDKYLDDARMSHLTTVRIVHGKGTGALRKAVHNYLRKSGGIKSFRLGDFGEGDAGVTIVTLK